MAEMTNSEAQRPQAKPGHGPRARIRLPKSLSRIGKYVLTRLSTIGIAVVIGVFLTIVIANWGGTW